jgi:hypothetical protein
VHDDDVGVEWIVGTNASFGIRDYYCMFCIGESVVEFRFGSDVAVLHGGSICYRVWDGDVGVAVGVRVVLHGLK